MLSCALAVLAGCNGRDSGTLRVSGQIEGVAITAGSRIGGRVAEVFVAEGDRVTTGQVLVQLDEAEAKALVAAAQAQLAQAQAFVAKLETGATAEQLRQAEAAAKAAEEQYQMALSGARDEEKRAAHAGASAAKAQLDNAAAEFKRAESLVAKEVVSQRTFDAAKAGHAAAQAQFDAANEKARLVDKGARVEEIAMAKAAFDRAEAVLDEVRIGAREEDRAAARAARDAAQANLDRAQVGLDEMRVIAPSAGVVESVDVHPGDLVKPGSLVRIVDPEDLELYVYVGAAMLGHLHLGQVVPLRTDAHGSEEFQGEIVHIASEGEYTPRNLQTEEERVQQVFGVKLKLNSATGKLRAGMTATVHLPKPPGVS